MELACRGFCRAGRDAPVRHLADCGRPRRMRRPSTNNRRGRQPPAWSSIDERRRRRALPARTPDFLNQHHELFSELTVPHPQHGGQAISLAERQLHALRDKIRALELKLAS